MNIDFRVHMTSAVAAVALGGLLVLVLPSNATDRAHVASGTAGERHAAAVIAPRAPIELAPRLAPGHAQGLVRASGGENGLRAPQAWQRTEKL